MTTTATEVAVEGVFEPSREPVSVASRPRRRSDQRTTVFAVFVWATLCIVAAVWGRALLRAGVHMQIGAPPLTGKPVWRISGRAVPVVVVGIGGIALLPVAARRLRWNLLLVVTAAATALWAVALDLVDGWSSVTSPVHTEYAATAARITSPPAFLSHFTTHIRQYNLHTEGHPPAMELILWFVGRLGWHGVGAATTLYIGVGCCAGVAALVALREMAGEERARSAAPYLVLFPGAIWLATSGDAFFAGVSATAIALLVLAIGRRGRRSDVLACAGGLLFGVTAFLSYGLVLLAIVPVVVAVRRRRWRPLIIAGAACVLVFVAFFAGGFSWFEGLRVARGRYEAGVASRRPYDYFLVADLAAFALALGPAVAIGIARLRDRSVWLLVGAAIAAVSLADLSGMSKGEVERIWLPFVPWVLIATVAVGSTATGPPSRRWVRPVLALQVALAIGIQLAVRSPW